MRSLALYHQCTIVSIFFLFSFVNKRLRILFNVITTFTKTVSSAACATLNIVTFCAVNKCPKLCSAILLLLAGIVCVCSLIRCSFKMLNSPSCLFWVVYIILSLCPGVTIQAKEPCLTESVRTSVTGNRSRG